MDAPSVVSGVRRDGYHFQLLNDEEISAKFVKCSVMEATSFRSQSLKQHNIAAFAWAEVAWKHEHSKC